MDDLIPVNEGNDILLPQSSIRGELWPLIISKAMLKLLSPVYDGDMRGGCEFGEANILQFLTGWFPATVSVDVEK